MSEPGPASRAAFEAALATEAADGLKALLVAPLGAGKSRSLGAIRARLGVAGVPLLAIDLFTAASTPERLLVILADSLRPFLEADEALAIQALATEGAIDRQRSAGALLRLFDLLSFRGRPLPFVWLVDEVTEIRSLAYFPGLLEIERPFARALANARGAILTSSYPGLAASLFPDFESRPLTGLTYGDVTGGGLTGRSISADDVPSALGWTDGHAASLVLLLDRTASTHDAARSLAGLLKPGGALEELARRQYDVLLMRSRGYAVCKRAAEAVATAPGRRLTDLYPEIGRTPGASRQYLRWLVEVGLLRQTGKRYDFADPIVGLWASLYLGRADRPTDSEVEGRVSAWIADRVDREGGTPKTGQRTPTTVPQPLPHVEPEPQPTPVPKRRPDRFEEFD